MLNVNGLILLGAFLALSAIFTRGKDKLTLSGSGSPEQTKLLIDFGSSIVGDIKNILIRYVIAYFGLGILCFIVSYLWRKRSTSTQDTEQAPPTTSEPQMETQPEPSAAEENTDQTTDQKTS